MRIAVCDDNKATAEVISDTVRRRISEFTDDFNLFVFNSGKELLAAHSVEPINIIFLDIDMPEMSGFDAARLLREKYSNSYIIFVTSYSELVYDSFEFQPFNFIRKNSPLPLETAIDEVVQKLMRHMKQTKKVALEDKMGKYSVYIHDIVYLESIKHYVNFFVLDWKEPIKLRGNLSDYERFYSDYDFVKSHKSFIVNLRHVALVNNKRNEIIIRGRQTTLPISRTFRNDFNEKYELYLRSVV